MNRDTETHDFRTVVRLKDGREGRLRFRRNSKENIDLCKATVIIDKLPIDLEGQDVLDLVEIRHP